MTIEVWIGRYFPEEQVAEVMAVLSRYGTETWHRERDRVWRDAVILSRGSMEKLRQTVSLAGTDYRDVLIGEQVDPWLIAELRKHGAQL